MEQQPVSRGRIYRACGCRDEDKRLRGPRCPELGAEPTHGGWAFAVDLPAADGRRHTRRRTGFDSREQAEEALGLLLESERTGVYREPDLTVSTYLLQWLATRERRLQPTTVAGYRDNVHRDLVPAFGALCLADLRPRHVEAWVAEQLNAGRGTVIVYRVASTLRTALNAAVRARRLAYNPAQYCVPARPRSAERVCWDPQQAAAFLHHNARYYADQLSDLFEVMIGTGMRRGEILGLHWADVHLAEHTLFVRWSLSAVNNNELHLGPPKTRASRNWIALSPRVAAALRRQAAIHRCLQPAGTPLGGLVFGCSDGAPLRPQWVLDQLRRRSAELALPRIGLHDLRHTAATIMISSGVPVAIVSKTLRHSTLATTVNLYGHLLKYAAQDATSALAAALDQADHERAQCPEHPSRALRSAA
jgi:integrase